VRAAELFSVAGLGAIVTGGASGLGLAIAEALAENGARVTLLDVDAGRTATETARLAALEGLALFLASPASAYLTGQQITIDGGWTLGSAD
jgi:NAD(P)-dependent dehydrogenase (short-subunit alcohol dehydrogenase family)